MQDSVHTALAIGRSRDSGATDASPAIIRVRVDSERPGVAARLVGLLAGTENFKVQDGRDADPAATGRTPGRQTDVLLLDCAAQSPQASWGLRQTARRHHPARVLWLLDAAPASRDAVQFVLDAVRDGWCHGYVVADCPSDTLARVIAAVARHEICLPRALLVPALSEAEDRHDGMGMEIRKLLTKRERQVIRLVQCGHTNKEAGRQLGIEEDTVKKHLRSVYAKLGVHRRVQLLLR